MQFWQGGAFGENFSFANWASGEPNDASGEDCAQFYGPGHGDNPFYWNDLDCDESTLSGYVVEYGGFGDEEEDFAGVTATVTIDVFDEVSDDVVWVEECRDLNETGKVYVLNVSLDIDDEDPCFRFTEDDIVFDGNGLVSNYSFVEGRFILAENREGIGVANTYLNGSDDYIGVYLHNVSYSSIVWNYFENAGSGVFLNDTTQDVFIANNNFIENWDGISSGSAQSFVDGGITGNYFKDTRRSAIWINEFDDWVISSNVIKGSYDYGFWINNSNNLRIIGNEFSQIIDEAGIYVTGVLENINISENNFSGGVYGIWGHIEDETFSLSSAKISNNLFENLLYSAIGLRVTNSSITGNTFYYICLNYGNLVYLEESNWNNISFNVLANSYYCDDGIYMSDSSYNRLTYNSISRIDETGIFLGSGSHYNYVAFNNVKEVISGFIANYADHNVFERNNVTLVDTGFGEGSSSPLVYTWNGEKYVYVADVGRSLPRFLEGNDYLVVDEEAIQPKDEKYSVKISQEYNEIAYYDGLALMTFDHAPGYRILTSLLRDEVGEFVSVSKDPSYPVVSCVDMYERNCFDAVRYDDDVWTEKGENNINAWVFDFGDLSGTERQILVIRGARNFALESAGSVRKVQVKNSLNEWVDAFDSSEYSALSGSPRMETIDLTGKFIGDNYQVRIEFDKTQLNYVAMDTSAPQDYEMNIVAPEKVDLSFRGFTAIDKTIFWDHDYYNVSPTPEEQFAHQYGHFTKYGEVTELLESTDDRFVIMRYGDHMDVEFAYEPIAEGLERSVIIYNYAQYKHAEVETGEHVEPLPFTGMTAYPYEEENPNLADEDYLAYLNEWNTREESKFGGPAAMAFPNSVNTTVRHNIIEGSYYSGAGIMFENEINSRAYNNTIFGFGYGIGIWGFDGILVEDNTIFDISDDGIYVRGGGLPNIRKTGYSYVDITSALAGALLAEADEEYSGGNYTFNSSGYFWYVLPFSIDYFGFSVQSIEIDSSGDVYLYDGDDWDESAGTLILNDDENFDVTTEGSYVAVIDFGSRVVIEWNATYDDDNIVRFQIVLDENEGIRFNYISSEGEEYGGDAEYYVNSWGSMSYYVNEDNFNELSLIIPTEFLANDLIIRNNYLYDIWESAIYLDEVKNVQIINNQIHDAQKDCCSIVYIEDTQDIIIGENYLGGVGDGEGIGFQDVTDFRVFNNVINGIELTGFGFCDVYDGVITENTIYADMWVYEDDCDFENVAFSENGKGNKYYFADGTPSWEVYDIRDTNGDNWADSGSDLPFSEEILGDVLWYGLGEDYHPFTLNSVGGASGGGTTTRRGGGSGGENPPFWIMTFIGGEDGFDVSHLVNYELKERHRMRISLKGKIHYVGVRSLTTSSALIEVASLPQQKNMAVGEVWKVDIDDDNYYDLSITLNSIHDGFANISVVEIGGEIPKEIIEGGTIGGGTQLGPKSSKGWIWLIIILAVGVLGCLYFCKKRKRRYH